METGDGQQAAMTHTTKLQVEQACLREAGRQFTQANCTPFLQPPLLDDFGEIGVDQPAFQAVVVGQYVAPPRCTPAAVKLLARLQCPSNIHDIDLGGVEEFNRGWKKARE